MVLMISHIIWRKFYGMLPNISNIDMYVDVLVNSISLCPVINTFLDSKYLLSGSICYVNSAQYISITGSACGHHPAHGDLQPPGLPLRMLAGALNNHLNLQRYKILFIGGNSPASSAGWTATSLSWKCAFTVFQLMTILEEQPQLPDRGA